MEQTLNNILNKTFIEITPFKTTMLPTKKISSKMADFQKAAETLAFWAKIGIFFCYLGDFFPKMAYLFPELADLFSFLADLQ